jgi:uncharacterized membrane protein YdjX (TVP38/TMEM64 family)
LIFPIGLRKNKFLNWLMAQKHPSLGMTLGFMVPVIPSVLVDYTAARLKVPANKFLLIGNRGDVSYVFYLCLWWRCNL